MIPPPTPRLTAVRDPGGVGPRKAGRRIRRTAGVRSRRRLDPGPGLAGRIEQFAEQTAATGYRCQVSGKGWAMTSQGERTQQQTIPCSS